MKKERAKCKNTEETLLPIIPEDFAELTRRLNSTLRAHLPLALLQRPPQTLAEECSLAVLGARNCLRRINLNDPDDVLNESKFADIAIDLLEAVYGVTVGGSSVLSDLQQYHKLGLIVPRYRILAGTEQNPLIDGVNVTCHYSSEGALKAIELGGWAGAVHDSVSSQKPPPIPPYISPVVYYRKRGLLLEAVKVGSSQWRRSAPLFCFSQIGQFLKIRRAAYTSVNLLMVTPKDYKVIRNGVLPTIKKHLEEIGAPRFCANPRCMRPLSNDPRNLHCSLRCHQQAIEIRKQARGRGKKKPKTLKEPFISYAEPLSPHSIE